MQVVEYRVVWKREELSEKRKIYQTLKAAKRFMALFGPEPWKVWAPKADGDSLVCCPGIRAGYECACDGVTYRQQAEEQRSKLSPLEYLRLEFRDVGVWVEKNLNETPLAAPERTARTG